MKASLILKGKPDFFNRQPVCIRWSDKQKRKFKRTDLLLTKEQFERFHRASPQKHEADLYRRFLSCMDRQPEKEQKDFFQYCSECIHSWDKERSPETIRQQLSEVTKLKKFKASFNLSDVTPDFLQKYKNYCRGLGNTNNTLWKTFKFIRLIILKAKKERLIQENPFDIFEIPKYKDPEKHYLVKPQIKAIEKVIEAGYAEEINFAARWFLIGCYTGLRFSDMQKFDRKRHIINNRLVVTTQKTREVVGMPLLPNVKKWLEGNDYKPLSYSNQHYNRLLKVIGALAEIDIPITAHLSRHSAAVLMADAGISQEVTARLLGHVSLRTTSIYYRITNKRIDAEVKKLK